MTICNCIENSATRVRRLLMAPLGLLLVTALLAAAKAQAQDGAVQRRPVEGSWIATVKALNGSFSFTALVSFAAGGVWLATGSNDRIIPNSPLYGSWKHKGDNRFLATADFFTFDSIGNAIAMNHIVQEAELKHDGELVVVGEFSVCDVQGESCQRTPQADFSFTARRIVPADLTELTLPPE
jgi:hypothetical protein